MVGHLAGNAYALVNLTRWAATGTETPMYPSMDARASEIEDNSDWPWRPARGPALRRRRCVRPRNHSRNPWLPARDLRMGSGASVNVCDVAAVRIREVQVHRVDLAGEYQADDWSTSRCAHSVSLVTVLPYPARGARLDPSRDRHRKLLGGGLRLQRSPTQRRPPDRLRGRPAGVADRSDRTAVFVCSDDSSVPTAPKWVG